MIGHDLFITTLFMNRIIPNIYIHIVFYYARLCIYKINGLSFCLNVSLFNVHSSGVNSDSGLLGVYIRILSILCCHGDCIVNNVHNGFFLGNLSFEPSEPCYEPTEPN